MRKIVLVAALAGMLAAPVAPAEAGHKWFSSHKEECPIGWEEQEVTAYRLEQRTEVVPVVVHKTVSKVVEEPYKYTELVPVTVPEKRTITTYKCVPREVPYTYNVKVPVTIAEKRSVTTYKCVAREVPFTYTVQVPVTVAEKRTVTTYICVPEEIVKEVPVCKKVKVVVVDPCTGCSHKEWTKVTEWKTTKYTVTHKVPQTKEITVHVCSYKPEVRTGTKTVYDTVPETKEITVHVCSYKVEQRTGTYTVLDKVPATKEITVQITRCQPVEKTGIAHRVVCEKVQETVQVTRTYCEKVPYKTTVKVPVYAPACH